MNRTLEKRVSEIEGKVFVNNDDENRTRAIFRIVIDASAEAPPIEEQRKIPVPGWVWEDHEWVRREGETAEELEDRAIEGARRLMAQLGRHPSAIPCFHPVKVNDDDNDEKDAEQAE